MSSWLFIYIENLHQSYFWLVSWQFSFGMCCFMARSSVLPAVIVGLKQMFLSDNTHASKASELLDSCEYGLVTFVLSPQLRISLLSQTVYQCNLLATRGTRRKYVNGLAQTLPSPLLGKSRKHFFLPRWESSSMFIQDKPTIVTRIFVRNDGTENTLTYKKMWKSGLCPQVRALFKL